MGHTELVKFVNDKCDMIATFRSSCSPALYRIANLKNIESDKNVMESFFKIKTFKSLKEVMESFFNGKNFTS